MTTRRPMIERWTVRTARGVNHRPDRAVCRSGLASADRHRLPGAYAGLFIGSLLAAGVTGWLVTPTVLAHGGSLRLDGDPAHLVEDLLVEFGLPLLIILGGGLLGVVLSKWLGRSTVADSPDLPAAQSESPVFDADDQTMRQ